ncbi:MAG TPA: hypothetical protein VK811_04295 [Candidatus Acidoferrum sp.]|jgi:hypothetical protein|nr:hypothetical protein [Candidatus Acidoferrum sp.]
MQIFRVFAKMIGNVPTMAILRALEVECKMLEDDLAHKRLSMTMDTVSILCFREFAQMAKLGIFLHRSMYLPPDHIDFYKETIVRLVQAGELPPSAMNEFDHVFEI